MAVKVLTLANAQPYDTLVTVTPEAATAAADGFEVSISGDILFLVSNASADTAYDITFKVGNGMQATADFTEEIAFGVTKVFRATTGRFKDLSTGKIKVIPEHTDVKVKAIEI